MKWRSPWIKSARVVSELEPHRASMDKLKAIPGFDTRTVEDLVAEIGFDMSKFPGETSWFLGGLMSRKQRKRW